VDESSPMKGSPTYESMTGCFPNKKRF